MKIIFCNIAYMRFYDGRVAGELKPLTGGRWVAENEDAHEKWNFLNFDGFCYGFVQGNSEQMHIENLDKVYTQQDSAEDVTVVWCASHPERGTVIVGWYEHATINRYSQRVRSTAITGIDRYCWFSTKAKDAYLLPEELRTFPIGRAAKDGTGRGFGQQNYWFAKSEYARKELIPTVVKFIEDNRDNRVNAQNTDFAMPDTLTPLSSKEERLYEEYSNDEANLEILNMSYRLFHNNPSADTAYSVAATLAGLSQYRLSIPWYEKTLELDPTDINTKGILAYTYQQCEFFDKSDRLAKELLATEKAPEVRDELYCMLADNAHHDGRFSEGIDWLDTIIDTSSNEELVEYTKGTKEIWENDPNVGYYYRFE